MQVTFPGPQDPTLDKCYSYLIHEEGEKKKVQTLVCLERISVYGYCGIEAKPMFVSVRT